MFDIAKINRAHNGYDPHEVEILFHELQKRIEYHKNEIRDLTDTLNQYEKKVPLLIQNTKRMEEGHRQEIARLKSMIAGDPRFSEQAEREARQKAEENSRDLEQLMKRSKEQLMNEAEAFRAKARNEAKQEAEKILSDARQEAEQIRKREQTDFEERQAVLIKVIEEARSILQLGTKYWADKNAGLEKTEGATSGTLNVIPAEQTAKTTRLPFPNELLSSFSPEPVAAAPKEPQPVQAAKKNPYEEFLKEQDLLNRQSAHPPQNTHSEIVEHFGK